MAQFITPAHFEHVAEPEYYETPDPPPRVQNVEEEEESGEGLEREKNDLAKAYAQFKDCVLEARNADFSEGIGRGKSSPGYIVVDHAYEMGDGVQETLTAKFNRLKYDVEEIKREAEHMDMSQFEPSPINELSGLAVQVHSLHRQLLKVNLTTSVGAQSRRQAVELFGLEQTKNEGEAAGEEPSESQEITTGSEALAQLVYSSQLSDLDKRLSSLERTAGQGLTPMLGHLSSELVVTSEPGTVQGVVAAVAERVCLLTGQRVDDLAKRIARVKEEKLQCAVVQKPETEESIAESDAVVTELHKALARHKPDSLLPSLLSRMQSLHGVHSRAADVATTLSVLQGLQTDLRALLIGQDAAMTQLHRSVDDNNTTVEANMAELSRRLGSLGL